MCEILMVEREVFFIMELIDGQWLVKWQTLFTSGAVVSSKRFWYAWVSLVLFGFFVG